jgi:hypothetical protein
MSTYHNATTNETRDFDAVWFAEAVAAENPKVIGWTLRPDAPSHTSTQHPPEWTNGQWTTRDKTEAELAADARKVWTTKAEFWDEFTESEKLAIMDSAIPPIRLLDRTLLVWSGEVWSDDARVQAGLTGLVAVGILTAERKAAILAL